MIVRIEYALPFGLYLSSGSTDYVIGVAKGADFGVVDAFDPIDQHCSNSSLASRRPRPGKIVLMSLMPAIFLW